MQNNQSNFPPLHYPCMLVKCVCLLSNCSAIILLFATVKSNECNCRKNFQLIKVMSADNKKEITCKKEKAQCCNPLKKVCVLDAI